MKISRRWALTAVICSLAACTNTGDLPTGSGSAAGSGGAKKDSGSLAIKGSDTMVILGQRWAESFMKKESGASVQVTGGGSGTGIAALVNGTTDICQSSRPMKDKEKADVKAKRNAEVIETKVALDALAVYVNEKSSLTEIAVPDLAKIYKGELTNWKDLGGPDKKIVLYGRENNSGTYAYFKEHVLENKDFAAETQTLAGTSAVVAAVKGDEGGIGYGGIAYTEGVRLVKVKKDASSEAITPTLETAQKGTYPLARFLYFYTAGDPGPTAKKFIEFVVSEEGQKVIGDVGYYPLPKT